MNGMTTNPARLFAVATTQPWAAVLLNMPQPVLPMTFATARPHPGWWIAIYAHGKDRWDSSSAEAWNAAHTMPPLTADDMVWGAVVAVGQLVARHLAGRQCGCLPRGVGAAAENRRWHWELSDLRPLDHPVVCGSAHGLWTLPARVAERVRAAMPV